MGRTIELTAADGHRLAGYLSEPAAEPAGLPSGRARGGIVVVQEIFGVTRHIRAVADQYAAAGYLALAPALFDRVERNVDVPYGDVQKGVGYMQATNNDKALLDLEAAVRYVGSAGKVGVVGFCWGGTLAYLAAAKLEIDAAVAYYGGGIERHLDQKPTVPVLLHFGEKDSHISPAAVAKIKAACPEGVYHLYPAEHGFNCNDRASFEPNSAELALERSLNFLHRHIG
jgi:carboxymethylenebutenolidase